MLRTNEIKSIMRQLRENPSAESVKNESLTNEAEETNTENDTSDSDLLLARLEDIISRFEKALAIVDAEEAPAEDEEAPDEEAPDEEAPAEDEETAEESYSPSLEDRLAALERRFTESRRRKACRKFCR